MFCPNCAAQNNEDQNYCRACGLKLDAIVRELAEQFPSQEFAALARRKRVFEILGMFSLSIFVLVALMMLLAKVILYKAEWLGADVLFYSAFGAVILFGLLSVFFFNYPKIFMNFDKLNPRLDPKANEIPTNKLLADPPFEPASVVEKTTELLQKR